VARKPSVDNGLEKHMQNFVGVIKSRRTNELKCPIESASHVAVVSQMGNIALRSGQKLYWDKMSGKFTDNKINKKYLAAEYHNGYKLPKV
jgi:hypothetical protein